ncbi:metal-binding protein [Streptomyces sp. CB02959]|uniref:CYTH and CHAD domain-containing protein n=1 Tax=Streptomyces sp. CB02959 TaxID=2020330 RepID=UPI000C2708C3|nr:CYTH and CHAD domain-containing protein [Streptomyces sp. CB02959]PJN38830.1 metal-binding protein [Streptomyces sp. CB02959]
MADTVREVERKYEADAAAGIDRLPDLTRVDRVAAVVERGTETLDALYYDTADQRLAADGITLRRRTGGSDAGWHLKLPAALPGVTGSVRDEIRAPLADTPPPDLTALARSRTRDAALVPLVRLRTRRTVHELRDADGALLAEVAVDDVAARRRYPEGAAGRAHWREIEVELAPGGGAGQELLDAVEEALTGAGARPAAAPSKLARALAETAPEGTPEAAPEGAARPAGEDAGRAGGRRGRTAGEVVLRYVRVQVRAIVELDPAARRDLPDAVHQMRVATRRLRSAFRSYGAVLDRAATDPLGAELKWLAAELGVGRDQEVLADRLTTALAEVPRTLRLGPVSARLRTWSVRRHTGARDRLLDALDGPRYLALLENLHALLGAPPLRGPAARPAPKVVAGAVRKDYRRLARRIEDALGTPAGPARDEALHSARKAAKRTRYAAEAAVPALGRPAAKFTRRTKQVQQLLGDHQDSVVARAALRELAAQAHRAGESGFTFGLLYGREEARAAHCERELPALWAEVSRRRHRDALRV